MGKLPWETYQTEYLLEYGASTIEMHRDGLEPGQRVLVVDDVLATGGTLEGTLRLVEQSGAVVVGIGVLLELRVSLNPDESTFSGYQWSTVSGPPQKISAGTMCEGSVTVVTHRPFELVIPMARKKLGGD